MIAFIIGGGMGGLMFILAMVGLCVCISRRRNNKLEKNETVDVNPEYGEDYYEDGKTQVIDENEYYNSDI